jgi:diguanylate cyclase (GGDEF)-like protein
MQALLSMGCRLFGVETGFLGKLNEDRLQAVAVISPDARLRRGRFVEVGHLAGPTPEAASPQSGTRAGDWRDHPFIAITAGETFLGAPVYVEGSLYGLLYFSDPEPRERPFEAQETQFCQLMALWVGSEIDRRRRQAAFKKEEAELLATHNELQTRASVDGLTGVKNRRSFDDQLQAEFSRTVRNQSPLSLIMVDVDHFKQFNDSLGHQAGDEVLRIVARLLQASTKDEGLVARYGGEEFSILLPGSDEAKAAAIAERLRLELQGAPWPHRPLTASFGVAQRAAGMSEAGQLVAAADAALYRSKNEGRNRVSSAASNLR